MSKFSASLLKKPLVKSFNQIPSPKAGDKLLNSSQLHERCIKLHRELGSIYRDFLGPTEMVFIADSTLIQSVMTNEGIYPRQSVPTSWLLYNRQRNIERGLFFQTGPAWKRIREVSNKVLLKDEGSINRFSGSMMNINDDMFKLWEFDPSDDEGFRTVKNLKFDLCKWSIEATSYMLFEKRLDCLSNDMNCPKVKKAVALVESVAKMFDETTRLNLIPSEEYETEGFDVWKQFKIATDTMLHIASSYANESIDNFKKDPQCNGLLKGFLESNALSDDEISRTMVDFIVAAADTTSSSLQWMLYLLSRYPDVEEKVFNEVNSVFSSSQNLDECRNNLTYLRSFMKETSRFYPTAPFLARTLDKDIVLGNYQVPANIPIVLSLYASSRSSNYFAKPQEFKPERWLRSDASPGSCPLKKTGYSLASLPFGIGARNCVGRRMAELQMCLFLASFVKRYSSRPTETDIGIRLNMILGPSSPIQLKLKPRQ